MGLFDAWGDSDARAGEWPAPTRRAVLAAVGASGTIGGCLRLQADSPETRPTTDGTAQQVTVTETVEIDPSATYLRTSPDDDAQPAEPLALDGTSLSPGQAVRLVRLGDYDNGVGETFTGMLGVFSSSDTLRASDRRHRVPDAINSGPDVLTPPTHRDDLETDIPEDFAISPFSGERRDLSLTVPDGATHLFVAALDNSYHDNVDPDGDFALGIA